jgi:hypothetical protein
MTVPPQQACVAVVMTLPLQQLCVARSKVTPLQHPTVAESCTCPPQHDQALLGSRLVKQASPQTRPGRPQQGPLQHRPP